MIIPDELFRALINNKEILATFTDEGVPDDVSANDIRLFRRLHEVSRDCIKYAFDILNETTNVTEPGLLLCLRGLRQTFQIVNAKIPKGFDKIVNDRWGISKHDYHEVAWIESEPGKVALSLIKAGPTDDVLEDEAEIITFIWDEFHSSTDPTVYGTDADEQYFDLIMLNRARKDGKCFKTSIYPAPDGGFVIRQVDTEDGKVIENDRYVDEYIFPSGERMPYGEFVATIAEACGEFS